MRRVFIIVSIASFLFLFIFWHSLFINITKPQAGHGDITYQYFVFDNNFKKISSLNFSGLFNSRMFYPRQNTLAYGNAFLVQSFFVLPIFLITSNTILSVNSFLLLNYYLAFIGAYFLAYKFTRSVGASLIAGLIYTYNPYVFAHNQIELLTILWIPFIFLAVEFVIEKVTWKSSSLLFLLLFLRLASSFYYFIILVLLLPVYVAVRLILLKINIRKFITSAIIIPAIAFVIASFIFIQPFLNFSRQYHLTRSIIQNDLSSARIDDFLFTSPGNFLYGNLGQTSALRNPYDQIHFTEHSLFMGITVGILVLISFFLAISKKNKKYRLIFVPFFVLLVLSFLLSLGPTINVFGVDLPFLYWLVYKFIPFADTLRAPSRFMVIGFLSISILSALSFSYLESRIGKYKKILFIAITLLIVCEYFQIASPPAVIDPKIFTFYSWLNRQPKIHTILELPIGNELPVFPSISRDFITDSQYLLYGVYHNKNIINGYNAFIPPDYVNFADEITLNFPDKHTDAELKNIGVDLVIVHLEEYPKPDVGKELMERMKEDGYRDIYKSGTIYALSK